MPEYPVLLCGPTKETSYRYRIISRISISYYSLITYSLHQTQYNVLSTDLHL